MWWSSHISLKLAVPNFAMASSIFIPTLMPPGPSARPMWWYCPACCNIWETRSACCARLRTVIRPIFWWTAPRSWMRAASVLWCRRCRPASIRRPMPAACLRPARSKRRCKIATSRASTSKFMPAPPLTWISHARVTAGFSLNAGKIVDMNSASPVSSSVACPVCGGPTHVVFRDLYDDRYGYPDAFTLYECDACGHMHIPTSFSPDDLGRLYTQYYPRGNFDLDSFRPEQEKNGLKAWLNGERGSAFRWVPRNVRVLDIGCGIGATLAYHKSRGCEAIGMEADGNVQAIAKRYGLDIRQGIFDGTQFEPSYFDYVTLDQVAEHVTDPLSLMRGVGPGL